MSQPTQTVQSSTSPNSAAVQAAVDKLAGGIGQVWDTGPKVFENSMYTPPSETTKNAWAMATGAADNPAFAEGMGGTIDSFAKVARGDYLNNMDPEFQALVDRSANETAADINASMGANGRYGSNVHVGALADEIGALRMGANVDNRRYEQTRQMEAAQALPGFFSAAQLPASIYGNIGAAQDADAAAKLAGDADLFDRTNNAKANLIARLSAALGGSASAGGTTTSQTSPATPWWQTLGGMALGGLALV